MKVQEREGVPIPPLAELLIPSNFYLESHDKELDFEVKLNRGFFLVPSFFQFVLLLSSIIIHVLTCNVNAKLKINVDISIFLIYSN